MASLRVASQDNSAVATVADQAVAEANSATQLAQVDNQAATSAVAGQATAPAAAQIHAAMGSALADVAAPSDTAANPMLTVEGVWKSFGSVPVLEDISFSVPRASTLVLLGPSGCGKTTLLRVIAGLERPDKGQVWRGEELLTGGSTYVDVRHRRIGMVFQDLALFPHMSVFKNVAYGLPHGQRRNREIVEEAIALVNLEGLEHRRPHQLSGGQQQRVALARALVPRPEVILFDEPFASLDTSLRIEVRSEVHELLHALGTTAVFVTHDQEEAFVIGEEVVVMKDRRIVQHDRPSVLYRQPVSPWVGLFVGHANMLPATIQGTTASTCIGDIELLEKVDAAGGAGAGGAASAAGTAAGKAAGKLVNVLVRPEHLQLVDGSAGKVELVEYHGHDTMYAVRLAKDGTMMKVLAPGSYPQLDHGAEVDLHYIGPPVTAFPAEES